MEQFISLVFMKCCSLPNLFDLYAFSRWLLFVWVIFLDAIRVWFSYWHKGWDEGEIFIHCISSSVCLGCFMQFALRKQHKGGRMQKQVFPASFPPSAPHSNSPTDQTFWTLSPIELNCTETWHKFSGYSANIVTVLMARFHLKGKIKLKIGACKALMSYKRHFLLCCRS